MKRCLSIVLVVLTVLCVCARPAVAKDVVSDDKDPEYLFVQTADSGEFDGKTLTLKITSPVTVYFSDRPYRVAGHMPLKKFVDDWNEGSGSFRDVPPNGVVSILTDNGTAETVVTFTNPRLEGDTLMFDVTVLKGDIPASCGILSLFIDERPIYFGDDGMSL